MPEDPRFLLDSMVYDALVADAVLHALVVSLRKTGKLQLLATHIQWDEISDIPDEEKRIKIGAIFPLPAVPTYGVVVGTSKRGHARIGEPDLVDAIRSPTGGHTEDSLTATTARYEEAILVTDDHRLTNFARREGIDVWNSDRFVGYVRLLA